MTTKEINDIKPMASTAGIYLHSAQTLENVSLKIASSSSDGAIKTKALTDLISSFLLYSLSSEISLKVILKCEEKNSARAHDLQTLFSLVDEEHQNEIKTKLNNSDFDNLLIDHKDNFVSWRYFYEGNSKAINVPFLKSFASVVFQVAKTLLSNLKPDDSAA